MGRRSLRIPPGVSPGLEALLRISRKLGLSLFFAPFLAFGLWVSICGARGFALTLAPRFWPEAECEVIESGVKHRTEWRSPDGPFWRMKPPPERAYLLRLAYRYTVEGGSRIGTAWKRGFVDSDDYAEVARVAARYPVGSRLPCRFNPADPAEAVLEYEGLLKASLALVPLAGGLLFAVIGALGLYFAWYPEKGARLRTTWEERMARANDGPGRRKGQFVFGGILVVFSLCFLTPITLYPIARSLGASRWTETPCTVLESRVESGSRGRAWIVVLYEYQAGGTTRRCSRYSLTGGASSGRTGKDEIVRNLPPGTRTMCWVNPSDPFDAVLDAGVPGEVFFGLIPGTFLVCGAVFIWKAARRSYR